MHDAVVVAMSGSLASGLIGHVFAGEDSLHNQTRWEQFYARATQRHPDGCLSVDAYGGTTYGEEDYGNPATFVIRVVVGAAVGLGFFRWQIGARNHWPTKRFIPDLQNKGPHRAKVQCFPFNCFPANPHLGFRIHLLPLPTKPYEFIDTGMWQGFVFTWPYSPRFDEPLLTQCARDTVSILVLAMQLLFFVVLGSAAASWADVTKQGFGFGAAIAVLNVYIVSVICAVTKLIFLYSFGWSVGSGGWAMLTTAAASSFLLGLLVSGVTTALTNLTCVEFATHIAIPFLLKQPMALVVAPVVYAFRNSFGAGLGVKGIVEMWNEVDEMSGSECVERLTDLGRAADLHVADDGRAVARLGDVLADVEAGDALLLASLRRALKETIYVIEASQLHANAGLTSKNEKTGEWKAGRKALVKKLKQANALSVIGQHPMRQWRLSEVDRLASVLHGQTKQKEAELADVPQACETDDIST